MSKFKLTLLVGTTFVLCLFLGLVVADLWDNQVERKLNFKHLAEVHFDNWLVEELPMAESLVVQEAMDEYLNYDDGIHMEFSNGEIRFNLFVTYWAAGKMDPRSVHGHTPDVCWVRAGWTIQEGTNDDIVQIGSNPVMGSNRRIMDYKGQKSLVYFWHFVDGKPYSFHNFTRPPIWSFLSDLRNYGLNLKREQVFCRISFERKDEDQISDASLNEVYEVLEKLEVF
ncbi:EpsI family protein [bacterium]|nr:EpsI family protein [bacterium]